MTDVTSKALRQKQQRRAAGTPYGVAGAARSRNDDNASAGIFSRFLKKIPIINQLVGDDEDEEFDGEEEDEEAAGDEFFDSDDAMNSEQEESTTRTATVVTTESAVVEVVEMTFETPAAVTKENNNNENVAEQLEQAEVVGQQPTEAEEEIDDAAVTPPKFVNELANAASAAFVERGPTTPSSKAPSPQSSASKSSPNFAKRPRSPQAELGPVLRSQRRKNSSTQKAFMPVASQKSKALRIGGVPDSPDDEMRRIPRRRVRLASSPMDSPLAVIKHKKTISYEEYERLSLQLRGMVESSPQASLALTQNALNRGFDERPNGSFSYGPPKNLTYVPGTMSLRDSQRGSSPDHDKKTTSDSSSSELQLANGGGAPFGKRARLGENRPIYFSGFPLRGQMLTREERVERKPRPSRLLTGAKRDAAARSAYSSAVAEKILSTLNKVQNPLEREAKKPTPQTSLSWAKYHLALTDGTNDGAAQRDDDESMDEVAPPTSTIPRVSFPSSFSQSSNDVTSFQSFTPSPMETPAPKSKLFSAGSTPMSFSPQDVSMTPVSHLSAAAVKQIAVEYGSYSFSVPAHSNSIVWQGKRKAIEEEIEDIQFVFSPPPSQREPPKRVSSQKARKVRGAVETPFSFVPASPKARAEWLGPKPTTQKKPQEIIEKPASAKPAVSAPAASSGSVNPLVRFAQLAPGQWKCPTCSVSNEAKHAKCPCCETTKPSGSADPAPSSAGVSTPTPAVSSGFNPLAKFAQLSPGQWKCPTCSVTNEAKHAKCPCCETTKPGASSAKAAEKKSAGTITSSGFSFGVPAASAKPTSTEAPRTGGFSFGVTTPVETKSSSSVDDSVPSFTFSAPPVSVVSDATKPSFSFGVAPDASNSSASRPSFAFSTPATSISEDKSVASTGFSFGVSAASEKKSEGFGVKAAATTTPSFSFGSTTTSSPVKTVSSSSSAMGFSFGADVPKAAASTKSAQESSGSATKKASFSFGVTEAKKPETSTPAFSFDTAKAAAPAKAPESTPSFSFGSSGSAAKPATPEPKPAFSFGAPPSQPAVTAKPSEPKADAKPAFTFGASSTDKPSSEINQEASSKSTFGFGQSSTSSPPKPAAPAPAPVPSFGSSAPSMFGGIAAVTAPSFGAAPAAPAFGSASSSAPAALSFTFGAQSSSAATTTTPAATTTAQPAFTFGASSASTPATAPAAVSTGFGSTSSSSAFGGSASSTTSTSAGPSFTFGANASQSSTQPQSTFGFGASASAPASTGFGVSSTPATSGFGSSSAVPAASGFGSSAPATSGFGSTAPASSGFGAPAASGFGSAASASTGFGAPAASGFGSSTPASSGFGMSTPAASGFGTPAPAVTGFGASAPAQTTFGSSAPASSVSGSAPASSSFGATAPATSGFGAAPSSSSTFGAGASFGASPATAFGAPNPSAGAGFGAQQTSTFGGSSGFGSSGFGAPAAPAFGAAAPSAAQGGFGAPFPAFGAPAAAPSSGFGAPSSGGFGAPSSGGFGAAGSSASFGVAPAASFNPPTASFGAPAGGFGAPQEGGFSVGAAPQAGPKRRILKARSKRT